MVITNIVPIRIDASSTDDAEVYGAVRSSKHYLGGRLDLLSDAQLYSDVKEQVSTQLSIALNVGKNQLASNGGGNARDTSAIVSCNPEPSTFALENTASCSLNGKEIGIRPNMIRIKLRLRQENIVVVDEFDYDVNLSVTAW
ncbi:hypothetical protein ACHAW6_011411 [Cyclotella cf. meneghiniana]